MAPLRFATMLGLLLALTAFLYGAEILYETWVYGAKIPGYPSLFVGVMVLGGVQLIMLGVVGEYIGKISTRSKDGRSTSSPSMRSNCARKRAAPRATPAPRLNSEPITPVVTEQRYITTTLVPTFTRS